MNYLVICWPESQMLSEYSDDWQEHCSLINDESGLRRFGSCAYIVEYDWYRQFEKWRRHVRQSVFCCMVRHSSYLYWEGNRNGDLLSPCWRFKRFIACNTRLERLQYVLLHTNGEDCQLFKLKTKGHSQIWTRETLEQYGFEPRSASYYVVLHFDASKPIPMKKCPDLQKNKFTFQAKIRPLSDFMGIKWHANRILQIRSYWSSNTQLYVKQL